jgi:hypothetical protein
MSCLVYYEPSGKITGFVSGSNEFLQTAADEYEGLTLLSDISPEENHYVKDGALADRGQKPSNAYEFNFDSEQWELSLEIAQTIKWVQIKQDRDAEEFGTFEWGGYAFQCDEVSQRRIQGAVQLAAIDASMSLDWTLADNSVQTFTAADYVQIGQALANHVSGCHERGRILRQQIESATTETELEAIVW